MNKLFFAAIVLASTWTTAHAAQIVSDFENAALGLDGWTVTGDPALGSPLRIASGGNPGGYAEVTDAGTGQVMYWVAPAKFTGDLSVYFNGALSYDMRQSPITGLFQAGAPGDIAIAGAAGTLVFALPPLVEEYPQDTFTTRTLRLNDQTAWQLGTASGPLATNAQIQSVLGGVTALRIRAEYSLNIDVNSLDNVKLLDVTAIPEPSSAALLLGGAALLAAWRLRQRACAGNSYSG
jgi:Laminin B (Domain IV)/PEP-CTERM motif